MKLDGLRLEKPPKLQPETRRQLGRCVRLLTSPDEEQRRAFVPHFLQTAIPAVRNLVIDRLVNILVSGSEANRGRAAATLADMGSAAFSAVKLRLLRTRSPRLQAPLVDLLVRIGEQLPPSRQLDVVVPLELARLRARSASGGRALLTGVSQQNHQDSAAAVLVSPRSQPHSRCRAKPVGNGRRGLR